MIFDNDKEKHTAPVIAVLEMLRKHDMYVDIRGCVFDAKDAEDTGFKLEKLGREHGCLMIVDLGYLLRGRGMGDHE